MKSTTTTATMATPSASLRLADIEAAIEKLRGMPPAKWMLIAPDCRVWAESDTRELLQVLLTNLPADLFATFGIWDEKP